MNKQVKQIRDEIERLQRWSIDTFTHHGGISTAVVHVLTDLLDFIDSIEEPEVDLEKEIEEHVVGMPMSEFTHDGEVEDYWDWGREEFRYFFELGLKAQKGE